MYVGKIKLTEKQIRWVYAKIRSMFIGLREHIDKISFKFVERTLLVPDNNLDIDEFGKFQMDINVVIDSSRHKAKDIIRSFYDLLTKVIEVSLHNSDNGLYLKLHHDRDFYLNFYFRDIEEESKVIAITDQGENWLLIDEK